MAENDQFEIVVRSGAHVHARSEPRGSAHGWTDRNDVPTEAVVIAVADFGLEYTATVQFQADQLADPELAAAWRAYNDATKVIWDKLGEARDRMEAKNA
jgi:hypothetical protein